MPFWCTAQRNFLLNALFLRLMRTDFHHPPRKDVVAFGASGRAPGACRACTGIHEGGSGEDRDWDLSRNARYPRLRP